MAKTLDSKTAQTYSLVVTLAYFTIYSLVFLATSVYCAYTVRHDIKQNTIRIANKPKNNDNTQTTVEMQDLADDLEDDGIAQQLSSVPSTSFSIFSITFMKLWSKSIWRKKNIYISIVPHLFDQATDLGVLIQYYRLWKNPNPDNNIQVKYWFFSSIAVIILHKVISSWSVWLLSKNIKDVIYQFFDVLMVKAIYANYVLGCDEPSSGQRYLQILEGTFESGPQILIGMTFILKTVDLDAIVLVSLITSLWTLTIRIASDDKSVLKEHWKRLNFSFKTWPPLNPNYLYRLFLWRFAELTNKVTLYSLIWLVMGGFALVIVVLFEFVCCAYLAYLGESFVIMGNMLYWTIMDASVIREQHTFGEQLLKFATVYRFLSLYVLLIIITIFAATTNKDMWKVPESDIFDDLGLGFGVFIYCWVTAFIWPISLLRISQRGIVLRYAGRDPQKLIVHNQFDDLSELIEFSGVTQIIDYRPGATDKSRGTNMVQLLVEKWKFYKSDPKENIAFKPCMRVLKRICIELQAQRRNMDLWMDRFNPGCHKRCPLEYALANSFIDIIDVFIDYYYDYYKGKGRRKQSSDTINHKEIRIQLSNGFVLRTLPELCAEVGTAEMMEYLVEAKGVKLQSLSGVGGYSLLHRATETMNDSMIRYLVDDAGLDPSQPTKDSRHKICAIHIAAKTGYVPIVKYFIKKCEIDPNVKDATGKTCADYALEGNNRNICVQYLVSNGCAFYVDQRERIDELESNMETTNLRTRTKPEKIVDSYKMENVKSEFKFLQTMGSGSSSKVKEAQSKRDPSLKVAIKIIDKKKKIMNHMQEAGDVKKQKGKELTELYQKEKQILETLHDKSVINLIAYGEDDDCYYIVSQLLLGGQLFDRIVNNKQYKITERVCAGLMRQMLYAVKACHDYNVVHRDLRPENFVFEKEEEYSNLVLIDFGCARIVKDNEVIGNDDDLKNNDVYYWSPELAQMELDHKNKIAKSGKLLKAADMWSIGVIAYVMMTGRTLFDGRTRKEILKKIVSNPLKFPKNEELELTGMFKDFCKKMLDKNYEQRLTVDYALRHPWVKGISVSDDQMNRKVHSWLSQYSYQCKLKEGISRVLAAKTSSASAEQLKAHFVRLDDDGDGFLDKQELEYLLMDLGFSTYKAKNEAVQMIDHADLNNDGKIDFEEFKAMWHRKVLTTKDQYIHTLFNVFDKNGNGLIDSEELGNLFGVEKKKMAKKLKHDDKKTDDDDDDDGDGGMINVFEECLQNVKLMISEIDEDGDGQINFEEFEKAMKEDLESGAFTGLIKNNRVQWNI